MGPAVVLGHPGDRQVARLGAAAGEDHASRLGADEPRDLVARLFNRHLLQALEVIA